MCQPAENRSGRVGACATVRRAADRWEPQEPALARRSLFRRAVLFGGRTLPRLAKKQRKHGAWANMHNSTTGRETTPSNCCATVHFHNTSSRHAAAFPCLTLTPERPPTLWNPRRPRALDDEGLGSFWARWIGGHPIRGRIALLWMESVTCTRYLFSVRCTERYRACSDSSGRRFGGSWFPIEKKKLSAGLGLDDESDSCGDQAVNE